MTKKPQPSRKRKERSKPTLRWDAGLCKNGHIAFEPCPVCAENARVLLAQRGPTAPPREPKEQYVGGEVIGGGVNWSWKAKPPSKQLICKARGTIDVKGVYVEPEHSIVTLSGHVRPFADQQPRILSQMEREDWRPKPPKLDPKTAEYLRMIAQGQAEAPPAAYSGSLYRGILGEFLGGGLG